MKHSYLALTFISFMTLSSGCASREAVAPSQNSSLNSVSPSGTAVSEGGAMQRSLDSWLKEEWSPLTTPSSAGLTRRSIPKEELDSRLRGNDGSVITSTAPTGKVCTTVIPEPVDETPFTLQKYADKWKAYHENQAKLNEGKPKEVSNIKKMESMPVIGK